MYWHSLIWVASLWAITFPVATVSLALMFDRAGRDMTREHRTAIVQPGWRRGSLSPRSSGDP
jgi:hypothetical protein